jgi:hypothetical protein
VSLRAPSGELSPGPPPDPAAEAGRRRRPLAGGPATPAGWDRVALLLSLAGAFWLTSGLWSDPGRRALRVNASDQALFEWLLSYAANAVTRGHNPLWTDLLNAPVGVNLAVNTSITVLGVLLAPVTLTLGAPAAFLLALTANLAASGYAWYLLLARRLGVRPPAALLGGAFCGFAPGVVAHANGHLNFTAQFLLPLIIARVLALHRTRHPARDGALLGLLVAVQFSIGAELLFFTALGCAVFLACWWLAAGPAARRQHRAGPPAFARGLAVTALVAAALLAYPLWMQFAGPGTYHGTGFDQRIHSEDALAYGAFPRRSLAGVLGLHTGLAPNPTEENSFLGLPLLLLAGVGTVLLLRRSAGPRRALLVALAGTGALFALLSLGPVVKWHTHLTHVRLPYAVLARLPLFDSALPARLALVVVPVLGALLALGADTLPALAPRARRTAVAALALALLPLAPMPLLAMDRYGVPHFVTSGAWRRYVQPGQTLVPVPPPSDLTPDGQRWQAYALSTGDGQAFRIPAGFFLGPGGPNGRGRIGPVPRPTYQLLSEVALRGATTVVTDQDRLNARDDLRYWRASVVVLPDGGTGNRWHRNHAVLLRTLVALFGEGRRVDDVWLWTVPG